MNLSMTRRKTSMRAGSSVADVALAKLRLNLIEKAKRTSESGFNAWLKEARPTLQWDLLHLRYNQFFLDQVTRGVIKRLMVFMPPRHGKSEQNTIGYSAYRIELDPSLRILMACHTQGLATKFSRAVKKIAENRVELNPQKRSAAEWETMAGGGLKAVGVLGVGGGIGAGLFIGDDVIKNAKQANSPTYRANIYESYQRDIKTRLTPDGAMILTFTRWHQQDLAGMILDSDEAKDWTVIKLPALAKEDDPLGRPVGMALWPEQWSRKYLLSLKRDDPLGFTSLYDQDPQPPGGDLFKEEWLIPSELYVDALPAGSRYVRYWDKASTKGGTGAYTAGVLMARTPAGMYVVCDVVRGRWDVGTRESMIRRVAEIDGPSVEIWQEQEPGSGGKESAQNTAINLAGFIVWTEVVRGEKWLRAVPMASQFSIKNVKLLSDTPARRWNKDFVAELLTFPQGRWKDQVDAAAGAFNKLALTPQANAAEVSGPRYGISHNPGRFILPDSHLWSPDYDLLR